MARKNKEPEKPVITYPRIILGLDVSTKCVGACIVKDYGGDEKPEVIKLTHVSPKVSRKVDELEALFKRKDTVEESLIKPLVECGITDVVIEEPLVSSNNAITVSTLLRFNGMISESVYRNLGIVPKLISSYDARSYSFPELISLRKYNKKGEEYPVEHILKAIKKDNIVLFGAYPYDIDKKNVMMNLVNDMYPTIKWVKDEKTGELRKENYDACDSLVCVLAYININHHGIEKPVIYDVSRIDGDNEITFNYTTRIWGKLYHKTLVLKK